MENRPTRKPITVEMNDIVLPAYTNRYNALFGGKLMEMIDKAAAICAIRYCHENVVTASVEAVDFHQAQITVSSFTGDCVRQFADDDRITPVNLLSQPGF